MKEDRIYLIHILECIEKVEEYYIIVTDLIIAEVLTIIGKAMLRKTWLWNSRS